MTPGPDALGLMVLSALKIFTLVVGATFVFYAVRAWLRHRPRSILLLTAAIAILSAGLFVEGAVFWLNGSLRAAHIAVAMFTLVGFSVLLYSMANAKNGQVRRKDVKGPDEQARARGAWSDSDRTIRL